MVILYDRIWTRGPNSNIVHFLILIAHKITIFVRIMSSKLLWVKKQYRLYIRKSLPMIGRPVNIYWPFFKNYVRIRAPYGSTEHEFRFINVKASLSLTWTIPNPIISNHIRYELSEEIIYPPQTSVMQPLKFGNG